jgi:hypothetical protein
MKRDMSLGICLFFLLEALGVVGRWLGPHDEWLALAPNFTPMSAIGLFAGYFFARRSVALLVPLAALIISNLFLESYGSWSLMASVYASFLIAPLLGQSLRVKPTAVKAIVAVTLPALFFYLTTNLAQWLVDGQHVHMMYTRDGSGLVSCYAAGIPFFRWMLEGDLLFSGLLFGVYGLARLVAAFRVPTGRFLAVAHVSRPDCRC